jgi:hypothetical protein
MKKKKQFPEQISIQGLDALTLAVKATRRTNTAVLLFIRKLKQRGKWG